MQLNANPLKNGILCPSEVPNTIWITLMYSRKKTDLSVRFSAFRIRQLSTSLLDVELRQISRIIQLPEIDILLIVHIITQKV